MGKALKSTIEPEDLVILVDTREQLPWDTSPMRSKTVALDFGDYSVQGLERRICVERKSLPDLVQCVGRERERFEKHLDGMASRPCRCVIVEARWEDVMRGGWHGQVTPRQVMGTVLGWMAGGTPFLLAGGRQAAREAAMRFLFISARRCWEEIRSFGDGVLVGQEPVSEEECENAEA